MLSLRPPGLEFRILCLEGSVVPFISPSSEGSFALPSLVYNVRKGGIKPLSFHLYYEQHSKNMSQLIKVRIKSFLMIWRVYVLLFVI